MSKIAWDLSEIIEHNDNEKITLAEIFTMIHNNPNNMILGKRIRAYYHDLLETTEKKIVVD